MTYNEWRVTVLVTVLGLAIFISVGLMVYEERRFRQKHPDMYKKRTVLQKEYRGTSERDRVLNSEIVTRIIAINEEFKDIKWCKVVQALAVASIFVTAFYLNVLDVFGGKYVGFETYQVNTLSKQDDLYKCRGSEGYWLNLPVVADSLKDIKLESDSTYFDVLNIKANYKQLSFGNFISYTVSNSGDLQSIADYDIEYSSNTVQYSYEGNLEREYYGGKWAIFKDLWLTGNDIGEVLRDLNINYTYNIDLVYNKQSKDFKIINAVKKEVKKCQ